LFVGKDEFEKFDSKFYESLKQNDFIISIIIGAATSILAGIATLIFKGNKKK
jgi:hypothetical protein